jgi:hypothetical protein
MAPSQTAKCRGQATPYLSAASKHCFSLHIAIFNQFSLEIRAKKARATVTTMTIPGIKPAGHSLACRAHGFMNYDTFLYRHGTAK